MSEPRAQPASAGPGSTPSTPPAGAPTMEEILTSIRRIIAESDNPPEVPSPPFEVPAAGAAAPGPAAAPVLPSPFVPPPVLPSARSTPAPVAGSEPLVLTRMLAEDGSVVSLEAAATAAEEPLLLTSPLPSSEAAPVPLLADILEATDRAVSAALTADAEPRPPAPTPEAVASAPAAAVETPAEPSSPAPRAEPLSVARDVAPEPAPPLWLPPADLAPPPAPPEERSVEPDRAGGNTPRQPAPRGELTIEALVREVLEPRLQAWLNEHLEAIVERRVQQEIDRISRLSEK